MEYHDHLTGFFHFLLDSELFEEKTLLERQVEEVRRELENARSEQMQFVQQSGRQQTEHTEQVSGKM